MNGVLEGSAVKNATEDMNAAQAANESLDAVNVATN